MKLRGTFLALASLAVIGLALQSASANTVFQVNGVAKADVSATAGGLITIVLTNLTSADNTTSAANLLTGINFIPTDISSAGYSITGQTGAKEFIFGTSTTGAISSGSFNPHWALTDSPNGLYFNGFGTGGLPIIGGDATGGTNYNHAGSSLTAGPHGTYIYETATFTIQGPTNFNLGVITSVDFLFNTDGGTVVHSSVGTPTPNATVPLPAAVWSGGALIVGLAAVRRMKRKSAV